MKFLVDECTGPAVARWLRSQGHDVFSVFDDARGLRDDDIISRAKHEDRILVTNDKGFGEKVYRQRCAHSGLILLRLDDERAASKISALDRVLDTHANRLKGRFTVVTESAVRMGRNLPNDFYD